MAKIFWPYSPGRCKLVSTSNKPNSKIETWISLVSDTSREAESWADSQDTNKRNRVCLISTVEGILIAVKLMGKHI